MVKIARIVCLGLLVWASIQGSLVAAQQAARGAPAGQKAKRANQAAANNGNVANPAVQQLLQQFDANKNGVLDGAELVQVATAFQQLVMGRMAQAGGGVGGMQGGAGQGFGNQGGMQGMGGAGFGNANGGNQHRFQHGQGGGGGVAGGGAGRGNGGQGGGGRHCPRRRTIARRGRRGGHAG